MNSKLGYKTIITGDAEIPILYTNRSIANAERIMEKGIIGVLSGFQDGGSGIAEVAILLQVGMEAARRDGRLGGKRISQDDAFEVLDELGFTAIAAVVFEAVGEVIAQDSNAIDAEFSDDEKN